MEIIEVEQVVTRKEGRPGDIDRVKLAASRVEEEPHRATAEAVADGQSASLAPGCNRLDAEQLVESCLVEADGLGGGTDVTL